MPTRKVFISYRSVDRERVRVVAEALIKAGIDVWWDEWEIKAGDNFVTKINQSLSQYDCGLVFLSNESLEAGWQWEEITVLKDLFVSDKKPLIPIVLDLNVKVPTLLRVHSRLRADQIEELKAAIEGRTSKPTIGEPIARPSRLRFVIALKELAGNAIGVTAKLDGKPLAPELPVHPSAAFYFSYSDFLNAVPSARMGGVKEMAAARSRELQKLGEAVGMVVFAGTIGQELAARINAAPGRNEEIELIYEADSPRLLSVPFEAARLPDGSIPALIPGVFTMRCLASQEQAEPQIQQVPTAGPLRVLVAVGAPDEGKTPNSVLDGERELQTILDALEDARRLGNAYVRVLEVGSPQQIGAALRERSYHVLHLSGHGNQGVLELEDEDGKPVPTDAAALAEKIRDSGHSTPLVFLASCHGGLGDSQKAAFAQGLLQNGVPSILAMQTAVSDWYATELAGKFYKELSQAEEPLASRALALARRTLEQQRLQNTGAVMPGAIPEYATPSLLLRSQEQPVLNRALEQMIVQESPPLASSDAVPLLKLGELIGRRREMREIVRTLTGGRQAGVQILGTGGVGKSSLAGRIMQRMADRGWPVATVSGAWSLAKIAAKLGSVLWDHPQPSLAKLAKQLNNPEAPDNLRIEWLLSILAQHKVLLVLDNFEDVLTAAGAAFRDPIPEQIFGLLLRSAQSGKLLITCRYPVPDATDYLRRIDLGPLSPAETRKLMLRHPGLAQQPVEGIKQIERAIGGHPRTLEYLDALLRNGAAQVGRVQERLRKFAAQEGVSLDGSSVLAERMQDAVRIAAADAMVEELVRVIAKTPGDLKALRQASVFPFAVPEEALAFGEEASDSVGLSKTVDRLVASSLLAMLEDRNVVVHRWTAESLKTYIPPEDYRAYCAKAAEYLVKRPVSDLRQKVADLTESTRLFLAAREFDQASRLTWALLQFLQPYGQVTAWTELLSEVSAALPDGHDDKLRFIGTEGDGLLALGFAAEAIQRYSMAAEISERLVAQEPARADYLRDLSVSYNKLGDLQRALGDGETARQFYEKSLDIIEQLAAQEPGRADYLRDLSVAYEKLGGVHRALGEGETARQFYERSLKIRQQLASQEPERADYSRDLSVSYNKLGDLYLALGEGETARQFYEKSLEIRERLVAQEPARADYLRDLSVSYNKLGDLQSARGEGETARQFYEKDLEIAERLAAQEPGRADYLRDLSISYDRMGDLHRALGQGEMARQFYEKSLEIRERLVAQEPGRADYLRDLSISYERMGDLHRALGQGETARQFYEKSLEIRVRLVAQEPGRADYLRDLSISYDRMGDLHRALGQGEMARQFYEKAHQIAERLVAQEPGRADYLRDLSVSYNNLGDLHRALGEGETARQFYEKDLEIAERLAAQEPERADYSVDLARSLARIGDSESLHRAFKILTTLKDEKKLTPQDEPLLNLVQGLIQSKSAGA